MLCLVHLQESTAPATWAPKARRRDQWCCGLGIRQSGSLKVDGYFDIAELQLVAVISRTHSPSSWTFNFLGRSFQWQITSLNSFQPNSRSEIDRDWLFGFPLGRGCQVNWGIGMIAMPFYLHSAGLGAGLLFFTLLGSGALFSSRDS